MKILVCGDSWSVEHNDISAWPDYLIGHEITNVAFRGAANNEICDRFFEYYKTANEFDLVIIGWSGCTRYRDSYHRMFEFCQMTPEVEEYYKDYTLDDFIHRWESYIDKIIFHSNVPVLQFSVFGDKTYKKYDNFLNKSFLQWLAEYQGTRFKYDMPIFEFDWLCDPNYNFIKKFAKTNFPKHWERACVERQLIRPSECFQDCGHPNKRGQKKFGEWMLELINDKFS